jgi:hypothetical protein
MKIKAAKNIIKQIVCWILLLQLINISIYTPHTKSFAVGCVTSPEDLDVNGVESIYELVSEGIFNVDVPVSGENDSDITFETLDIFLLSAGYNKLIVFKHPIEHYAFYPCAFYLLHSAPNSPPPKLV